MRILLIILLSAFVCQSAQSQTADPLKIKGDSIVVQISVYGILQKLSDDNKDIVFLNALNAAKNRDNFMDAFAEAWGKTETKPSLSQIFGTYALRDRINRNTTDEDVLKVIKAETDRLIKQTVAIIYERIDNYGIFSPKITYLNNSGKIQIKVYGVKDLAHLRNIIKTPGRLEYWETYDVLEIYSVLQKIDSMLHERTKEEHPLFYKLSPPVNGYNGNLFPGPVVGKTLISDTAQINAWFSDPVIINMLPQNLSLKWAYKSEGDFLNLIAIKVNTRNRKAPLDGSSMEKIQRKPFENIIDVRMNAEGARIWQRITVDNIGRAIAIVIDNRVYMHPIVQSEITGGRIHISGNFTKQEVDDIVVVLKSKELPAVVDILH